MRGGLDFLRRLIWSNLEDFDGSLFASSSADFLVESEKGSKFSMFVVGLLVVSVYFVG